MSTIDRKNIPVIIGLAIGLFAILAVIQGIAGGAGKPPKDVADDYYLLLQELDTRGLLPPRGEEELIPIISSMTVDKSKVSVSQDGAGLDRIGLSDVLYFPLMEGQTRRMEIKPQNWRDLNGGQLQTLVRRIAGQGMEKHQKSSYNESSNMPFSVRLTLQYRFIEYYVVPVFERDTLASVLITAKTPQ